MLTAFSATRTEIDGNTEKRKMEKLEKFSFEYDDQALGRSYKNPKLTVNYKVRNSDSFILPETIRKHVFWTL